MRKPWVWFRELNQEYGDVVYLQMGPTPTIILGSAQAAWDLLEKRGSIYSSRPRFIMGGELLSNGMRGLMAPYSAFWRRWRKLLHSGFMQRQSETYRPIQSLESKVLMHELLEDPKNYRRHLERYAASVVVTVTYGRRVEDVRTDAVVRMNAESMERLTQVKYVGLPSFLCLPLCGVLSLAVLASRASTRSSDIRRSSTSQAFLPPGKPKSFGSERTTLKCTRGS